MLDLKWKPDKESFKKGANSPYGSNISLNCMRSDINMTLGHKGGCRIHV